MSSLNWILLPWQLLLWSLGTRFQVVCAGRRCGKSNYAIKRCLAEALKAPKGSVVGYVGPTAAQSKQIGYDAMLEEAREFIKTSNSNAGDILLNKLEPLIAKVMLDVVYSAGEQIVEYDDIVTVRN